MKQDIIDSLNKDLTNYTTKFSFAVNHVLKRELVLHVTRPDQFRILNFISWSERYHITLEEMLKVLLPIWQKKFKSTSKGLGVRLSVLVGIKSKEIIKQYIKKSYPNGENVKLYNQHNGEILLSVSDTLEYDDPINYIKSYKENIYALRKKDAKLANSMQRRAWRSNPFN